MAAAREAFAALIDYAGLYPPASLPIEKVAGNYGEYRRGADAWMLGRLIAPVERLDELQARAVASGASANARWPVSVLVGGAEAIATSAPLIARLRCLRDSALDIESVEANAATAADVAAIASAYPPEIERFVEVAADPDPASLLAAIADHRLAGKVRTGGVTKDKFPSPAIVARFLVRSSAARVPVKATAGLHHAVRGEHRLTYAADSPSGVMHGCANLVFAAALLSAGKIDEALVEALLDDDRPEAFKLGGRAGSWLNAAVTYGEFAHARRTLLRSVGSCSFDEPVREMRALGWV
jgi:hypothetical protein